MSDDAKNMLVVSMWPVDSTKHKIGGRKIDIQVPTNAVSVPCDGCGEICFSNPALIAHANRQKDAIVAEQGVSSDDVIVFKACMGCVSVLAKEAKSDDNATIEKIDLVAVAQDGEVATNNLSKENSKLLVDSLLTALAESDD